MLHAEEVIGLDYVVGVGPCQDVHERQRAGLVNGGHQATNADGNVRLVV